MSASEKNMCKNGDNFCVIAVTGLSGSGKSTVCSHYSSMGYTVIDADKVAREVLQKGSECIAKLIEVFGADVVDTNGEVNRKLLAERAFATKQGAKALTDITHPQIVKKLLQGVAAAKNSAQPFVFVDGAVIIGGMFQKYCDEFIVVSAPRQAAIDRLVARDGLSIEDAEKRLSVQNTPQQLEKFATYTIQNDGVKTELLKKADTVLAQIIKK